MFAVVVYAWVLWAQTRTGGPPQPIMDTWQVVSTFETLEECERARVTFDPNPDAWPREPRYVCFPDTLDPQATP